MMLRFIYCNLFKQNTITFHSGLNIISGDADGSNSIGKTSVLLAIDFVFGGDFYAKTDDIIKNVGHHEICFAFEFDSVNYYFKRKTSTPNNVEACDSNFETQKVLDIAEYKTFLFTKYKITLSYLSWREIVSLYFRIYNKENYNEKAPLHLLPKEPSDVPVSRLIKLFGAFQPLYEQLKVVKETNEVYTTFTKAQKLNIIEKSLSSDSQLKKASTQLQKLRNDAELQKETLLTESINLSSEQMAIVYQLRYELSMLQVQRRKVSGRIKDLNANLNQMESSFQIDNDIEEFFPDVNLRKIEEINAFHKSLSHILKNEISKQIKSLEKREAILNQKEREQLLKINDLLSDGNDAKKMALGTYMSMYQEIENLVKGIDIYKASKKYKDDKDNAEQLYQIMFMKEQSTVTSKINMKLEELNDFIYDGKKKAPLLNIISHSKYNFLTPDDTGTGSRFRSLIVFDIAVMLMTQLPALCHDSFLFKNISIPAIGRIIQLYKRFQNKQVFISLDQIEHYPQEIQNLINNDIVIKIAPNGNELFGRSWNDK